MNVMLVGILEVLAVQTADGKGKDEGEEVQHREVDVAESDVEPHDGGGTTSDW